MLQNAPSFSRPQDGHAFVNIFHFLSRLDYATRALCTPNVQQENNTGRKRGKLWEHKEGKSATLSGIP
jgi:hypothetical protein